MIRINIINNELFVTKGTKIINNFVPAEQQLIDDVNTFNGNGYEHQLKKFNTFPELIKYCRNYA